jgi:protein O-GlcNAc transferase
VGYLNLGNLRDAQGNGAVAVDCYTRALALKPDFFEAQFNLGNVLKDQGRLADATACYRKALALRPDSTIAYANLANALKEQGELDEAVVCYEKVLKLNPDFPAAHFNLGQIFGARGELDGAVNCYRKALVLKPEFPEAQLSLGNMFAKSDKVGDAIDCYQTALSLKPDYPEAHFCLGQAFNAEGELGQAVDCYQKAISFKPDYAEARWALAMSQIPPVYEANADAVRLRTAFSSELGELERWFDPTRAKEGFRAVGVLQPFLLAYQEENNRALLRRYGNLCARMMAAWFDQQTFLIQRSVNPTPPSESVSCLNTFSTIPSGMPLSKVGFSDSIAGGFPFMPSILVCGKMRKRFLQGPTLRILSRGVWACGTGSRLLFTRKLMC